VAVGHVVVKAAVIGGQQASRTRQGLGRQVNALEIEVMLALCGKTGMWGVGVLNTATLVLRIFHSWPRRAISDVVYVPLVGHAQVLDALP
jgi:hypothetical protein